VICFSSADQRIAGGQELIARLKELHICQGFRCFFSYFDSGFILLI
jgi:hypothetical protein